MKVMPQPLSPTGQFYCVYDAWNRLTQVVIDANANGAPDEGESVTGEYEYDGLNRRVRKHRDTANSDYNFHFYYNTSWQIMEIRQTIDGQNHVPEIRPPFHQYVWSQRYIDALVLRDDNTECLATDLCDDGRTYLTTDANMNVTSTSVGGGTGGRFDYRAYGGLVKYSAGWTLLSGTTVTDCLPRYCGYWYDVETGLYCVRNRYYTTLLGRWTSRDPLNQNKVGGGYHDGPNVYDYGRNLPVSLRDSTGLAVAAAAGLRDYEDLLDASRKLGRLDNLKYSRCVASLNECWKARFRAVLVAAGITKTKALLGMQKKGVHPDDLVRYAKDVTGRAKDVAKHLKRGYATAQVFMDAYRGYKLKLTGKGLLSEDLENLYEAMGDAELAAEEVEEKLGKVNKVLTALVDAADIIATSQDNVTEGNKLRAAAKAMEALNRFNPVPGVSDMVDFYSKAVDAIGEAIDVISMRHGYNRNLPVWENCVADKGAHVPGVYFGWKWAKEVITNYSGKDHKLVQELETCCKDEPVMGDEVKK
jgi:RHS repeat-associated protein